MHHSQAEPGNERYPVSGYCICPSVLSNAALGGKGGLERRTPVRHG